MVFSWQMAEQLAAAHMRQIGFADARVTPDGADGGIDVLSGVGAAQVKYVSGPVGSPEIQRLRGAAHGLEHALFYASAGYSSAALVVADQAGVALFRYDVSNNVEPVNDLARRLSRSSLDGQLLVIQRIRSLTRGSRSVGIAFEQMLNQVRDGTVEMWPDLSEDLATIMPVIRELKPGVARQNEMVAGGDFEAALAIAEDRFDRMMVIGTTLAQKPSPVGELYAALAASAVKRLEAEHEADAAPE